MGLSLCCQKKNLEVKLESVLQEHLQVDVKPMLICSVFIESLVMVSSPALDNYFKAKLQDL